MIKVEGYDQLRRQVRQAVDSDIPKRLGEAHKAVGRLVISRLTPAPSADAVGRGAGAEVRPSATKREVLIRAGGRHRSHPDPDIVRRRQWGKQVVHPFKKAPPRPHIIGTIERHRDEIIDEFMDQVLTALKPVGKVSR